MGNITRIVIFAPTDVHSLELAGLIDVFAEANARANKMFYEVAIVAEDDRTIRCASPSAMRSASPWAEPFP
ncbi:hypothetical protein [Roseibium aggregatum]|uniref:hypothetical protein n=1 Tax=Roseibium aggregatum TaxID=187304 RepID=UPI001A8D3F29|nr:hypothetical protein [Roseibium aggregatum]MBN8185044.1 hypothetical protein [Roseibium aggregatum]